MEKGLKQFDKYITPQDLIGSSFLLTIEEEEEDGIVHKEL